MSGKGQGNVSSTRRGSIAKQVVLPFRKSLEISIRSLRVRFFRSLITTLTLVLAVAFLGYVLVSSDVATGLLRSGDPDLRDSLVQAGYNLQQGVREAGSSATERWIVLLSLLVCTVGIVNAQLMAVTERFREIGTMKCLGALDSFVLRLFLLEAGIQGILGAVAGALLGALGALLMGLARFGLPVLSTLSVPTIGLSLLAAVSTGFLLSVAGVIYPAIVAARMQPVEAMRVQE
ncbi:ABC-type transport system, involved in lipoprotein release, permease component [Desulfocurvibacter africanus PCS]|uniref:ABC-type transport system, involved in lipoprotein release, permease component n=1 Tax=Desulfocurvibacter africanus PCS TaxID=1262666 RepID=M5PWW7_DESAF|nr:FtsX-like permease family protein [Desulfocurvibacter africanus]EMG38812.1 ABC-type transport system, involved in lipoprotein release, permease component [Desulfocurvibacter africanus PCS]